MRIYLFFLSTVALMLVLASCSQKTSTATANTQGTSATPQANQRGSGERGQRGGRERPQFADLLTKMDANKDGKIELSETEGRMRENFTKIDTNADGFITEEEFKNAPRPQRPRGQRN